MEWTHRQPGTAQLLPRLIGHHPRGLLFLTDRKAPAGRPSCSAAVLHVSTVHPALRLTDRPGHDHTPGQASHPANLPQERAAALVLHGFAGSLTAARLRVRVRAARRPVARTPDPAAAPPRTGRSGPYRPYGRTVVHPRSMAMASSCSHSMRGPE